MKPLILYPLANFPLINKGDNVGQLIIDSILNQEIGLENNDIIVIAQKVISKAEGAVVDLSTI